MKYRLLVIAVLLAGCNAPDQSQPLQAGAETLAPHVPAPEAATGCERVADLFDELVRRKSEGMTEDEALAMLSDRGDYSLGYVVDGVHGDRYGTGGSAMARGDVLVACRSQEKGNPLY